MKRLAARILTGPRIGAFVAALMVVLVLPATARAEACSGHYLRTHSSGVGGALQLELLRLAGALAPSSMATDPMGKADPHTSDSERRQVPAPAPCSGAFCSGNPAPIPSSTPLVTTLIGEQWAITSHLDSSVVSGSSAFWPGDPRVHAVRQARSIFHPPPFLGA